jgi:hypothetical protein
MFSALKGLLTVPVTIKPFVGMSSAGDYEFGDDINTMCLPEVVQTVVTTKHYRQDVFGKEDVSNITLYIDGSIPMTMDDNIIFEGNQSYIKGLNAEYDKGKRSIWVVRI